MAKDKKKTPFNDKATFAAWIKGPSFCIYANFALSSWGDRMWQFAAGLYLVFLADNSLQLAAIFGFTSGTLMLIFGGIIGEWVDRNGRMKVVCISLFIQNISVALCAVSVCLALNYRPDIVGTYLRPLMDAIIIALAIISTLSSMAYKIAIEKDWIVVVASGNKSQLTNLNAVTRAIDLSCKILAPTVVGFIIYFSHIIAAVCIAVWNVISVFCEYALLRRVYHMVPELAVKNVSQNDDIKEYELKDMKHASDSEKLPINADVKEMEEEHPAPNGHSLTLSNSKEPLDNPDQPIVSNGKTSLDEIREGTADQKSGKKKKKTCMELALEPFIILAKGWRTYARQKVVFAGLSLSFLYMTVLGFDCITTGYIYANGVKESFVGISMAAAGLTGIIGTVVFTRLNKRIGLQRTGLIAFFSEMLCLTMTVASIWTPGSVFDPTFSKAKLNCSLGNASMASSIVNTEDGLDLRSRRDLFGELRVPLDAEKFETYGSDGLANGILSPWSVDPLLQYGMGEGHDSRSRRVLRSVNASRSEPDVGQPTGCANSTSDGMGGCVQECPKQASLSIILFLLGIVTSRVGLWMADLVVTQLLQENVMEQERGIVNGVQNSLNMLMDMIKSTLVIALPQIQTFGILILISFGFICAAGSLFVVHVSRFQKGILRCCGRRSNDHRPVVISELPVDAERDFAENV